MRAMALAQVEMSAVRAVSEGFGIDRAKALNSASVNKLSATASRSSAASSARRRACCRESRMRSESPPPAPAILADHACSLHLVVEGSSAADLAASMAALRAIGAKHGIEIENAAARVMRSRPFNPVRGMLGADGQRWVPIHAVFPLQRGRAAVAANAAYFKSQEAVMQQHGIILSHLTMTVGNEFFLEPAFYWQDEITPLHRKSLGDDVVGPWLDRPANLPAREAVIALRKGIAAALPRPGRRQLADRPRLSAATGDAARDAGRC